MRVGLPAAGTAGSRGGGPMADGVGLAAEGARDHEAGCNVPGGHTSRQFSAQTQRSPAVRSTRIFFIFFL
jgi:hypothetical protein